MVSYRLEGNLLVQTYPLLLALGVASSFAWLALIGPEQSRLARVDAGLAALAGGLIAARAAFVLAHPAYYADHLIETLWFWQGGLSWVGGAAGAFGGLAIYCILTRQPLWPTADALAIPAAIVSLAAWSGCWADGCAYGRRVVAGPLSPPSADFFGGLAPRWPTQAAGVLLSLGAMALAYTLGAHKASAGVALGLTLCLLAAGSLGLAFARGDPGPSLAGLRADALGSAAILLASGAITIARLRKR